MDTTKAPRTKPRSRLFDHAINSVKNQSSTPKLKIIEDTGHVPCFSSREGSAINVDSQDLVAVKHVSPPEVQCSFMTPDESENSGSNANDLSLNTIAKTSPEGLSLVDSLSNSSCVDYNLPICHSNYLLDNPGVLDSFNLIEHEKMCNSSNNNMLEKCSQDRFQGSFRLIPSYDECVDKSPDCSSDNALGIVNPFESTMFKKKDISKTVRPCVPGSEAEDQFKDILDKVSIIQSDISELSKTLKFGSFIENCSEDRQWNHDFTFHSNTSQQKYSKNKFLTNELACDKLSKSSLADKKCVNISLPKANITSEPKNTGIHSILSYGTDLDNHDSGYMEQISCFENELSSKYSIPINIVVPESKSAIEGMNDSRCEFEFIASHSSKTPQNCRIKVTLEVLDSETSNMIGKDSSNSSFSKSSSFCMLPLTVQIAEYDGEFSKSPIRYSSGFPNKNSVKSTESYDLPVAILISESKNSRWIPQTPDPFNDINVGCAANNVMGLSANNLTNTSECNNTCSKITRDNKSCYGKRNAFVEHQDKFLAEKYCANGNFQVKIAFADDKCLMDFPPKDEERDVLKKESMYNFLPKDFKNTQAVPLDSPFPNNTENIVSKSKVSGFSKPEFEEHSTELQVYKPDNFCPKSLCESCFTEYNFRYSMFITQFKDRMIDTSKCTCKTSLENFKSNSYSGEPVVDYSLPKFSSPESNNIKNLNITLSPINASDSVVSDWNLSELPNDYSLPISSSCCELSPFFQEEDKSIDPINQHGIKSSYSSDNRELGNSSEQDGDEKNLTDHDSEERDKRPDGEIFAPGCDLKMLCSTEFGEKFIDSHCHLDFLFQKLRFKGTLSEYKSMNESTFPKNYEGCIAVFCEPDTFFNKSSWEKYMENNVWASFGCHPHFSRFYCERYEYAILEALKHPQVKALGEIGLDYSKNNHCTKEIQHKVFQRQLKICVSKGLPLVLHCRDAHEDTLKFAKEILPPDQKIHLHCFTDTWHWAKKWMETFPNLCIGFTNHIGLNTTRDVNEVVKRMPLDRLLLETDAPYFLPKGILRRKYSHPGMAIQVAAQIAAIKEISLTEVFYWTRKNTNRVYEI